MELVQKEIIKEQFNMFVKADQEANSNDDDSNNNSGGKRLSSSMEGLQLTK